MAFNATAQDIRLDDGHILKAKLRNDIGAVVDAEIDLNRFIGNNDGHFQWESADFSATASSVYLSMKDGGRQPILRAQLRALDGQPRAADINLAERIVNRNGQFVLGRIE